MVPEISSRTDRQTGRQTDRQTQTDILITILHNCSRRQSNGWLEFNVPFQHKYGYIRDEGKVIIYTIYKILSSTVCHFRLDFYTGIPNCRLAAACVTEVV